MVERIILTEVGLRDGLQNQPNLVSTDDKLKIADALLAAGIQNLEVTSFAHPKLVPQMADAEDVVRRLPADNGHIYSVLTMNQRGYDRATAVDARAVAVVVATTDTFNEKNINKGYEAALAECLELIQQGRTDGRLVRAYVSAAWVCPYEGAIDAELVMEMTGKFFDAGANEVVIADTIGAAHPVQVRSLLQLLIAEHGAEKLGLHLHDTQGLAPTNCWVALELGIRRFDSSIGGLGGCPFAPGAAGNVATEDLVHLFHSAGFETGIDLDGLRTAIKVAEAATGLSLGGRVVKWLDSRG